jgi:hypothetical protein
MLNIRTVILSAVVLVALIFAATLVTARTEIASDPSSNPASVLNHQEQSASQNRAPIPSYRSPLDVCYDVPLREVASCRNASQVPVPSYRSPLDVCSDAGLIYRAQCLIESQKSTP